MQRRPAHETVMFYLAAAWKMQGNDISEGQILSLSVFEHIGGIVALGSGTVINWKPGLTVGELIDQVAENEDNMLESEWRAHADQPLERDESSS